MAYNKGLNLVTGTGRQTIDGLKNRVLSHDVAIEGLNDMITGDYQTVTTTLTNEASRIDVSVPDNAKWLFMELIVPAGSVASSATVRCVENGTLYDITRINSAIATSGQNKSGAVIYRIPGGVTFALSKAGSTTFISSPQMSIRKKMENVTSVGVVADSAAATFPVGTAMSVYYK